MEETINIAGVNCKVSHLATLTYEQLHEMALRNIKWKGVKNRDVFIDKELREHGFKPNNLNKKQAKPNKRKARRKKA